MSDIKKQKRWVVWNLEERDGKPTKVPYSVTGQRASSTDPSTWTTYEKAKAASEFFSGIGIVFTPEQTLLGIDIDHVLKDHSLIESEHSEVIGKLIKDAGTYTEISPSGTGLHLYLALTAPLKLKANRHAPFEVYTSGRFFTFTEQAFITSVPIRTVSPEEALGILSIIGYPWGKKEEEADVVETETNFTDEELVNSSSAFWLLIPCVRLLISTPVFTVSTPAIFVASAFIFSADALFTSI